MQLSLSEISIGRKSYAHKLNIHDIKNYIPTDMYFCGGIILCLTLLLNTMICVGYCLF